LGDLWRSRARRRSRGPSASHGMAATTDANGGAAGTTANWRPPLQEFDRTTDYVKAGPRRLADALELLEQPSRDPEGSDAAHRNLRGAAYLAGYAVECALKACIISQTPGCVRFADALRVRSRQGAPSDLEGRRAHNIRLLLHVTDLEGAIEADYELRRSWGVCLKWRPDWR